MCQTEIPDRGNLFKLQPIRRPTPLIYAICCHQINVVKFLVNLGADVTKDLYSWHPIHYATAARDIEIVDFLLSCSPDEIEALTDHKATPLHFAVNAGSIELTMLLLSRGANVNHANVRKETALHMSMVLMETDIPKILIAFGAKIDAVDAKNRTPYLVAKERKNTTMIQLIDMIADNPNLIPKKADLLKTYPIMVGTNSSNNAPAADPEEIIAHLNFLDQRLRAVEQAIGLNE